MTSDHSNEHLNTSAAQVSIPNIKPIGLVGLGAMGRGVATNLLAKNYKVLGFDVRSEAGDWLREQGGRFSNSLRDLGEQCEIIVSFVVNDAQTETVLFGDNGLAACMSPGSIFVACSTMPPAYVAALQSRLAERSIRLVDAPVTGGAAGALKGTLTVMTAGDPATCELVRPVLATFGARIYHLGEHAGAGAQMKVINQLLCGVHLAAAGEALALARKQGLPLSTVHEILCSGSGSSWMLGDRGPRMVREAYDEVTSAVDIFVKDLGLVLDACAQSDYEAPLASAAQAAFRAVSARGLGAIDDSAVILNYSDKTGQD